MTAHFGKIIVYLRVSTDEQGKSGLRLEAQREAILTFLNGGKWTLVAEFVEVERGKRSDDFAPSKANAHLPLPSPMGAQPRQNSRPRASIPGPGAHPGGQGLRADSDSAASKGDSEDSRRIARLCLCYTGF